MQMVETPEHVGEILHRRDLKVQPVLAHMAPVWLVEERIIESEDAVLFNLVFRDEIYGWLSRRYRYDAFNDVLYHMGERRVSEAEVLRIQQARPYIPENSHLMV
ncbi:MAG: hypothetical protein JXB47_08650 [Anaerolineae bacterium]|nr:hypothetical protein [Anaerolineae bacterium]